jgi:hypothetical protein
MPASVVHDEVGGDPAMRTIICGVLLVMGAGCGMNQKDGDAPNVVVGSGNEGVRVEILQESKVANLELGELWSRGEPKADTMAIAMMIYAKQHIMSHEKERLVAKLVGLMPGLAGPFLSSITAAAHPHVVATINDRPLQIPIAPLLMARFPLNDFGFDGPDRTYTRRTLLKASVPPGAMPARVEAFAKLLLQEIKATGATASDPEPVTEPRPGFRIRYETDTRAGAITIAAAKPGETQAKLTAEFPQPNGGTTFRQVSWGSADNSPLVVVALDERQK